MNETINISNPSSHYGALSNNFNGKQLRLGKPLYPWKNVSKSIYGRILQKYDSFINNAKSSELYNMFLQFQKQEENDIVLSTIRNGLLFKISTNKKLKELLLKTDDIPIVYKSTNPFLGDGLNGTGANNYGKSLEYIRHLIKEEQTEEKIKSKEEKKQQTIYNTYKVYHTLENIMRQGNDIDEYTGLSVDEIIEILGKDVVNKSQPPKNAVLKLAEAGNIDKIVTLSYNQTNIVPEVRKRNIQSLRLKLRKERNEIVFDMYADYLLEKFYPDLKQEQYKDAKRQQFEHLTYLQKNDLEEKLYEQYTKNLLSERLSESIDNRLASFNYPSQDEVDQALSLEIEYNDVDNDTETKDSILPLKSTQENILIYPFDNDDIPEVYKPFVQFSPTSFTGLININDFVFPNISLAVLYALINNIPRDTKNKFGLGNADQVYRLLLKSSNQPRGPDDFIEVSHADQILTNQRAESAKYYIQLYATEAIDLKLQDRSIQDILLITQNKKLVYVDENPYLGLSTDFKSGQNFVAEYLMHKRKEIALARKSEKLDNLTTEHISKLLTSDDVYLNAWFTKRVKDMCRTVILFKNYMYKNYGQTIELLPTFVEQSIDSVYASCSTLVQLSKSINIPFTPYFAYIVRSCRGFKEASNDVVFVIWRKIAVMMLFLINSTPNLNSYNIKLLLSSVINNLSKPQDCVYIVEDRLDNCILSAIFNIMSGVNIFINLQDLPIESKDVSANEVRLATSILLNDDLVKKDPEVKLRETKKKKELQVESKTKIKLSPAILEMLAEYETEQQKLKLKQGDIDSLVLDPTDKPTPSTILKPKTDEESDEDSDGTIDLDEFVQDLEEMLENQSKQEGSSTSFDKQISKEKHEYQSKEDYDEFSDDGSDDGSDYGSDYGSDDGSDDGFSPLYEEFIKSKLNETFDNIPQENINEIIETMEEMLAAVKNSSIPKKIKTNRINFFATL